MKKVFAVIVTLIMVLAASGCSNYIRSAVTIPITNAFYESYQVAVAVDYAGVKHIARTECPIGTTSNCILIYTRVISGNPQDIWSWSGSSSFTGSQDPDIAVTDGGVAAIVWSSARVAGGAHTNLYTLSTDINNVRELDPAPAESAGIARVESKLGYLYAINHVDDYNYISIRYVQLVGGSLSGWVSDTGTSVNNLVSDMAVSPSGYLYVTYRSFYGGAIRYFDNYGATHRFKILDDALAYTGPAIDVNGSPETVFMIYTQNVAPSMSTYDDALILAHCPASNCTFPGTFSTEFPLNSYSSFDWNVHGMADLVVDNGPVPFVTTAITAYYTFYAETTEYHASNVFEGIYQIGQPHVVVNLTNNPSIGGEPSIGMMFSWVPVTGWVSGNDIYEFDAFPFPPFTYAELRKVHHAANPILFSASKPDMACFADWGAGIWNEDDAAHRAFVIFNTYPAMLPLIRK